MICLWNIERKNLRAELGYQLHPDFHGKGIMHEALNAVVDYGFQQLHLHSICAFTDPSNLSSIKLLERNYFIREGHFKECLFANGKFYDSVVFSMLKHNR